MHTQLIGQDTDYNCTGLRNSCNNTYVKPTGKNARGIRLANKHNRRVKSSDQYKELNSK